MGVAEWRRKSTSKVPAFASRLVVEATLGVDFQHVCTAHSNSSARPSHPTRVLDIDGYRVPERWD